MFGSPVGTPGRNSAGAYTPSSTAATDVGSPSGFPAEGDAAAEGGDVMAPDFTYAFLRGVDTVGPARPPTITIPPRDLDKMAGMERQYWTIKAPHFDTVVFFKKGKFYELYDCDAVIASREFGLKMSCDTTNRGKMRMAGVPEQSFAEWARLFVFRGYKVGRVEQMARDEDEDDAPKGKAKIVPRDLVQIVTAGTVSDAAMIDSDDSLYVLALVPAVRAGAVFIDAFAVDVSRNSVLSCPCTLPDDGSAAAVADRLLDMAQGLLLRLCPREIVLASDDAAVAVAAASTQCPSDVAACLSTVAAGLQKLASGFRAARSDLQQGVTIEAMGAAAIGKYRQRLQTEASEALFQVSAAAAPTPAALLAGTYFAYLRLTSLDISNPVAFTAHQQTASGPSPASSAAEGMVSLLAKERREDAGLFLDAAAIENLEMVANLKDGSPKHSILAHVCRCATAHGRRMFRSWLLRPLSSPAAIRARQDACRRGMVEGGLLEVWEACRGGGKRPRDVEPLKTLFGADLERLLSRLSIFKNENTRVAFIDPLLQYNANFDLVMGTLAVFEEMLVLAQRMVESGAVGPSGLLPELVAAMQAVKGPVEQTLGLFNRQQAARDRSVRPERGMIQAYDDACDGLAALDATFATRLNEYAGLFGSREVIFSDLGKDLFLLEVPLAVYTKAAKGLPAGAFSERTRTTKTIKLIVTALQADVEEYKRCTAVKAGGLVMALRRLADALCAQFPVLFAAAAAFAYVDCLASLATTHRDGCAGVGSCFPTIVDGEEGGASLRGTAVYHPMLQQPVVNDVDLSAANARVLLITGPNMAGKSTMMRTVALAMIMAQIGGPVCAQAATISPARRVFTRIGARDAQHRGHSTLFVELKETADICRHADRHSLCLVDELGRGTSTHDGYAIAHATFHFLTAGPSPPLVIFSTHYHALAIEVGQQRAAISAASEAVSAPPPVQLAYMDFRLGSGAGAVRGIQFLYKMVQGICDRSYGVEVAAVAGIAPSILALASTKSQELAAATTKSLLYALIAQLVKATDPAQLALVCRKAAVVLAAVASSSQGIHQ